jgi:hypothetical protein
LEEIKRLLPLPPHNERDEGLKEKKKRREAGIQE